MIVLANQNRQIGPLYDNLLYLLFICAEADGQLTAHRLVGS